MSILQLIPWLGFAAGTAFVGFTIGSMINTLIVPRAISSRISYLAWTVTAAIFFSAVVRHLDTYRAKDRVLSLLGPISLLVLLATWLALVLTGYALILWPLIGGDIGEAFQISGSSILTLGFATAPGTPNAVIFLAAATGLVAVALLIGYLPTIYGAYNRRETLVTMLESRAGEPAWGPEVLARQSFINGLDTLPALYADWERWAADVAESHVSYPWLIHFRSPHPLRSWVTSLLAVMDSAALYHALAPDRAPPETRTCLRMGFTALRDIAEVFRFTYDPDPLPDSPLQLTYQEFLDAIRRLDVAGFPRERTPEEAWTHFRGWRVNYESLAYAIADAVVAVPTLWSGPRTYLSETPMGPIRPSQRSPEHPEGVVRADKVAR